jgi:hypothetical protein
MSPLLIAAFEGKAQVTAYGGLELGTFIRFKLESIEYCKGANFYAIVWKELIFYFFGGGVLCPRE